MTPRKMLLSVLAASLLLPAGIAHNGHEVAGDRAMSGGSAVCDTRAVPLASAQTPVQPQNYSIVNSDHGALWINVSTAHLYGATTDACVLTVSFNGARYGTLTGTGSGTAVGNPSTATCTSVGGTGCTTGIRVDWTIDFYDLNGQRLPDPTVYIWVDYTITLTAIGTGPAHTVSVPGTMWLYEPSLPWEELGLSGTI